jgi:hypothetical protein
MNTTKTAMTTMPEKPRYSKLKPVLIFFNEG